MIGDIPADYFVAAVVSMETVILARQLPGTFDSFAATRREEDSVEVSRGKGREFLKKIIGV